MSAGGTPGYRIQGASQPNNSKGGLGRSMWSTTMRPPGAREDVHPPSQLPTSPGPRQAATAAISSQRPVNVILPAATCTFWIAFPDPDSEAIYRLTLYLTVFGGESHGVLQRPSSASIQTSAIEAARRRNAW